MAVIDDGFGDVSYNNVISDAATFQIDFKTRAVTVDGELHIQVSGIKPFPIDRLSTDIVDLITNYVKDNMGRYAR